MKRLYKKISVGALVGLLIGCSVPQKSMAYANSSLPKSRHQLSGPIGIGDYYYKKYKILIPYMGELCNMRIKKVEDRNAIKEDKNEIKYGGYFQNGLFLVDQIQELGLEAGEYSIWIGGDGYKINVKKDIEPNSLPKEGIDYLEYLMINYSEEDYY